MLVADLQGNRVEATGAKRDPRYVCPKCKGIVILKLGRKVISHFAHKPPTDCTWVRGETRAHLEAKSLVRNALIARGLRAEVEYIVTALPGDRRADVMAWSPGGERVAFELQHTSLGLDEIEKRAFSYAREGIAQTWMPFLSAATLNAGEQHKASQLLVERYSPRPLEKWVHGLYGGDGMWMYAPRGKTFWHAKLTGHQIYVEEASWFEAGGEEKSAGGFYRWSKRYRDLSLSGPYAIDGLRIKIKNRTRGHLSDYNWPAARIASLVAVRPRP
jgi:competence CoiA-like predicted nuclease